MAQQQGEMFGPGRIKPGFVTNFAPWEVVVDGIKFPTLEHAYQAMKTPSRTLRLEVSQTLTPGRAKRRGKTLPMRADWAEAKVSVMFGLLRKKFTRETQFGQALMGWQGPIVEWNRWHDRFWGKCVCERCGGEGRNMLGKMLMQIREELLA